MTVTVALADGIQARGTIRAQAIEFNSQPQTFPLSPFSLQVDQSALTSEHCNE